MAFTVAVNLTSIIALSYFLSYIYHNTLKTDLLMYYVWMHFLAILVLTGDFFAYLAPYGVAAYTWAVIASVFSLLFSASFFCFSYFYGKKKHMKPAMLILLYAVPCIYSGMTLFLGDELFYPMSTGAVTMGLIAIIFTGIGYSLQFSGCLLIIPGLARNMKDSIFKLAIILAAFTSFGLQFMICLTAPGIRAVINPVMVLTIFSLIFIGSLKLGLFNTMSAGVRRSLELHKEAVFVLDRRGLPVYSNLACKALEPKALDDFMLICRNNIGLDTRAKWTEKAIEADRGGKILTVSIHPVKNVMNSITGFACVIHDDTSIKAAIVELKSKNEELMEMNRSIKALEGKSGKLAVMKERNRLAQEIHDVMGHSLNLALQTLESNKVILEENPELAIRRLRQVITDIDRGMKEISAGSATRNSQATLPTALERMSRRLAQHGITLDVINADDNQDYPERMTGTIYRLCQEACTNAISHGKADRITASIKEKNRMLQIHIIDNGSGCHEFKKGRGLSGMEERVEGLGGRVRFNSFEDGKGFMVYAEIPLVPDAESAKCTATDDQ